MRKGSSGTQRFGLDNYGGNYSGQRIGSERILYSFYCREVNVCGSKKLTNEKISLNPILSNMNTNTSGEKLPIQ